MSSVEVASKTAACLRVLVHSGNGGRAPSAELDLLVGKLINAFLETRWIWPRQFEALTPYAYLLSDPRTTELDKEALQVLAHELQVKLFGQASGGEVALLVFEGDDIEVHRFANLDPASLIKLANGQGAEVTPAFDGQLSRLTVQGVQTVPVGGPTWESQAAVSFSSPKFEPAYEPVYRAIYSVSAQTFVGNLAMCKPRGAPVMYDFLASAQVLPGVATEEFDEGCVESALEALSQSRVDGQLLVPLNFSQLIRPAGRKLYESFLARLPPQYKPRLTASIYETPRDPSYFALNQALTFLAERFGRVNLTVSDPAFEVEKLAPALVASVVLVLPEADQPARIAAIRAFMANRELFKRKRLWPGVTRVATRAELEACVAMRVAAIAGPAVAELSPNPVGVVQRGLANLPLRRPSMRD